MKRRIMTILRGFDVFANTLLGGRVRTISARLGEKQIKGELGPISRPVVAFLDWLDPNHCRDSYEAWKDFTAHNGETT